jgi:hypothetical protein
MNNLAIQFTHIIDGAIEDDLSYLSIEEINRYKYSENFRYVKFYLDGQRQGSGVFSIKGDTLIVDEVGGKSHVLGTVKFYLPFFNALGKKLGLNKILIGSARRGIMKQCNDNGFKMTFAEYEKIIE